MAAKLGVGAPSAAATYVHHVLPRLEQLAPQVGWDAPCLLACCIYAACPCAPLACRPKLIALTERLLLSHTTPHAQVRDAAMLAALRQLPSLVGQEPTLLAVMQAARFVPDASGRLHAPRELYDPRNQDLLGLLDPEQQFPSAAFCGAESALPMLQRLGLRTSAGLDTLLAAARFVAALWDGAADAAASERAAQQAEAAARGKVSGGYARGWGEGAVLGRMR